MIRLAYCITVLALAACPHKGTTTQQSGAGCPHASGVFVASYVTQDKGRSGWAVPLHAAPVSGEVADYARMDATTASAAGVPRAPTTTVWLATPDAPPCMARVGDYYAAKIEGPPATVSYGFELDGCPAPKKMV